MASLHPANPLLENIIASNPASSPAPERPLIDFSEFSLPPPSNLALRKTTLESQSSGVLLSSKPSFMSLHSEE
ncbi:hypothetical protein KIN20_004958 [Parelaphostrongylus tenuis]|uniref:Uncharacterized protein n=1 Tax=Parelaphostrongylus tenuis TaxID=148309 RepID=A0AAD5MKH4_PARTN|nr:hypothetical protein KIN20_004958 [Parelaphostrongylus tenuis]